jgi:ligand-binding sensor domain-containing protein
MAGGNKNWDRISSLQVVGEYLWVGTQAGLVHFDPGGEGLTKYYTRFDGLPADSITALAPEPAGRLWIGTWGGGVSTLDNGQIASHVFDQKRFNYVMDLAVGGGKVWAKSLGGMMVLDLDTGVWSRYY